MEGEWVMQCVLCKHSVPSRICQRASDLLTGKSMAQCHMIKLKMYLSWVIIFYASLQKRSNSLPRTNFWDSKVASTRILSEFKVEGLWFNLELLADNAEKPKMNDSAILYSAVNIKTSWTWNCVREYLQLWLIAMLYRINWGYSL